MKKNIKTARNSGFSSVEIIIVIAVISLLAAFVIPNMIQTKAEKQTGRVPVMVLPPSSKAPATPPARSPKTAMTSDELM